MELLLEKSLPLVLMLVEKHLVLVLLVQEKVIRKSGFKSMHYISELTCKINKKHEMKQN